MNGNENEIIEKHFHQNEEEKMLLLPLHVHGANVFNLFILSDTRKWLLQLRLHYHAETICYSKPLKQYFLRERYHIHLAFVEHSMHFYQWMKNWSSERRKRNYFEWIRNDYNDDSTHFSSFWQKCSAHSHVQAAVELFIFFMIHLDMWLNY